MQATVWRMKREYRTFRWQRCWLFGVSHCSGRPQPFRLNLSPFFPPFILDWFDLSWFIWRWWWQWWRENHSQRDSKNAYSKKCSCLSFLYATSADPVFLNCVHFLSSCMHLPPCYINSYGKNCFDICWPQLLHLWDWISGINLLVWASFQPPSEWLRFHCRHFPQMNQDQSRVKDGKTA